MRSLLRIPTATTLNRHCFDVNNLHSTTLQPTMAPKRTYIQRQKHYTPPPNLSAESHKHVQTPQRACIIFAKALEQELQIKIPCTAIQAILKVPRRTQADIRTSKQVRTLGNREDDAPDPRGRKRALTRSDIRAVADYLDDESVSLEDRGAPWLDIAEEAGVQLKDTYHFKPPGYREVNPQTVQRACKADEDILNAVCHEEKELAPAQARNRVQFVEEQLAIRPHSKDFENVYFCDEFHFGVGPQTTRRIKRKRGRVYRDKAMNVHRKKVTSKDTKAKAREEDHIKLISVFVIVGKGYRRSISYSVPNSVGKMTSSAYIEILEQLRGDLQGISLWQDRDSAHASRAVMSWAKKNQIDLITSPGNSPDLSIMETMAHPIKKDFHARRCTSEGVAMARFRKVFGEDTDQDKIDEMYNWYTKRLHECIRVDGQMTKY